MPNYGSSEIGEMDDVSFAAKLSIMPDSFLIGQAGKSPEAFLYLMALEGSPLQERFVHLCATNLPLLQAFKPGDLPEGFLAGVAKANPDGVLGLFLGNGGPLGDAERGAVVAALSLFDPEAALLKKWAPRLDDGALRGLIDQEGMPKGTYMYAKVFLGAVKIRPELQLFAIETHGARIVPYIIGPCPEALAIHGETTARLAYAEIVGKGLDTKAISAGIRLPDAIPIIREAVDDAMKGGEKGEMQGAEQRILASFAAASAKHPKTALLDLGKLLAAAQQGKAGENFAFEAVPEKECERACLAAIKAGNPDLPKIVPLLTPRLAKAYKTSLARKEKAEEKAAPKEEAAVFLPDPQAEAEKQGILLKSAASRISAIKADIRKGKVSLPVPGKAAK